MKKILSLSLVVLMITVMVPGCQSKQSAASATQGSSEVALQDQATSASAGAVALPKNIEVYVPASAGGGTDIMARTLATEVSKQSGSNLTVVNNTDGGGAVAFETVRTAKADGSKIMQFHTTMLIKSATNIYNHNAADEFKVIGVSRGIEKGGYLLVVSSNSPIKTLQDFLEEAKSNPGSMLIGVETGGSAHIMSGMLSQAADINLKYVEAGPDTEKLTSLVGGSINACLVNPNQAKQYVEAGKVTALAVVSSDETGGRSSVLPDIPSFIEQGINFSFATINIFLAPKDMDDAMAKQLYDYYATASTNSEVNAVLSPAGFQMEFLPYDEGITAIRTQQEQLDSVVEELGLKKK